MSQHKYVVGIDLGTTNTLACRLRGGKMDFLKFSGVPLLPSVIYVDEEGKIHVGHKAESRGKLDPLNMIRSSKTYIGNFELNKTWTCRGRKFTPTDVAAEILKEVRARFIKQVKCAEDEEIGAIITVPAYFNSNQVDETHRAGEAAGFKVMRIIREPMAAAIAAVNGLDLLDKKIFVVDLGGGTFDLSVLEADINAQNYRALATDGEKQLGGDDFDNALFEWLRSIVEDNEGMDLSSPERSGMEESAYHSKMWDLRVIAENAKKDLSENEETILSLLNIMSGKDPEIALSRDEFNGICQKLFDRITDRIEKFLASSPAFRKEDIGEIILAGGSCYIPYIQDAIQNIFGRKAMAVMDRATLVAQGAAHVAEWVNGGMNVVSDILSHSLGVEIMDHGRSVLDKILDKDMAYPCSNTHTFTTVADNQKEIAVRIYEAGPDCEDMEDIRHHNFYGSLILEGVELAPAGKPKIEVSFSYDKSGCLTVGARDCKTGVSKSLRMEKGDYNAQPPTNSEPVDFMILLDSSGSMDGEDIEDAKNACRDLIDTMIDFSVHRMGLISFENVPTLQAELSNDKTLLKNSVDSIRAYGGTNMGRAMELASQKMDANDRRKVIILVTDGRDLSEDATLSTSTRLKAEGYRIIAIGAGSGVDRIFLMRMASDNDVYTVANMAVLRDTFDKVIKGITRCS